MTRKKPRKQNRMHRRELKAENNRLQAELMRVTRPIFRSEIFTPETFCAMEDIPFGLTLDKNFGKVDEYNIAVQRIQTKLSRKLLSDMIEKGYIHFDIRNNFDEIEIVSATVRCLPLRGVDII